MRESYDEAPASVAGASDVSVAGYSERRTSKQRAGGISYTRQKHGSLPARTPRAADVGLDEVALRKVGENSALKAVRAGEE